MCWCCLWFEILGVEAVGEDDHVVEVQVLVRGQQFFLDAPVRYGHLGGVGQGVVFKLFVLVRMPHGGIGVELIPIPQVAIVQHQRNAGLGTQLCAGHHRGERRAGDEDHIKAFSLHKVSGNGQGSLGPPLLVVGNHDGVADSAERFPQPLGGHFHGTLRTQQAVGVIPIRAGDHDVPAIELLKQRRIVGIIGRWPGRKHVRMPPELREVLHELGDPLHTTQPHRGEVVRQDEDVMLGHT